MMKLNNDADEIRNKNQSLFFRQFAQYHVVFMRELISAYKQRGQFPLFPTFIANYYEEAEDKEIALMSTICMNWNKNVMKQIRFMREMLGEHPMTWFRSRGFVLLSVGRKQDKKLMGFGGITYWKIAKFFSMLYDASDGRPMRKTFPAGAASTSRSRLVNFAQSVEEKLKIMSCEYKAEVIELVLRASDGFSFGLWATNPASVRCPYNSSIRRFMKIWFPDFDRKWAFADAVRLFELDNDYDFFYFYLAWVELSKSNTEECVLYSTRYIRRYTSGILLPPSSWIGSHGKMPDIKFD